MISTNPAHEKPLTFSVAEYWPVCTCGKRMKVAERLRFIWSEDKPVTLRVVHEDCAHHV